MSATELDSLHLADLHALADEHGVRDYRKLPRRELIRALQESDTDELAIVEDGGRAAKAEEKPKPEKADKPDEAEGPDEPEDEPDAVVEGKILDPAGEEVTDEPEDTDEDLPTEEVVGVLDLTRQRYGFLRLAGLAPDPGDVYISAAQVRRCELRAGDEVAGPARPPRRGERHRALVHIDTVNGADPALEEARPEFDALPAVVPEKRIPLDRADALVKAVDLLVPLAFGQRILVRAAPRSGRTTLLRALAEAVAAAGGKNVVLLIDEAPEEATVWREALPDTELAIATADQPPAEHMRTAELALERSRRLAESGDDVVLICDSLSRLAFNAGGVDEVKRLFGSGRNLAGGGSLTVIAATVEGGSDEGEAERAVATTENVVIALSADLARAGVYPPLDPARSEAANEETLRGEEELADARALRAKLAALNPEEAAEELAKQAGG